ncbi:MAG: flavoprotein [Desulfobacterales bacterium]|nr:flavoprotein [Desulfobacterales bacterium]
MIGRLVPRLGGDGRRGAVIVVFTGATVQLPEAVRQVRRIILDGYRVKMVFTAAAERLYAAVVREKLEGYPYDEIEDGSTWLSTLEQSRAVLVPLLSVNTLSKLALLIADNLPLNLVLHALFMGKPVVVARNGADPADKGRAHLGFSHGKLAMVRAIRDRLQTLERFGCCLSDIFELQNRLRQQLCKAADHRGKNAEATAADHGDIYRPSGRIVTAGHVRQALLLGSDLLISSDSVVTPLAKDLASQHGLALEVAESK